MSFAAGAEPPSIEFLDRRLESLIEEPLAEVSHAAVVLRLVESVSIGRWFAVRCRELTKGITNVQIRCNELKRAERLLPFATSFRIGDYYVDRIGGRHGYRLAFPGVPFEGTLDECLAELRRRGVEVP